MGRSKKPDRKRGGPDAGKESPAQDGGREKRGSAETGQARAERREQVRRRKAKGARPRAGSRFQDRRPVLRFVTLFALCMAVLASSEITPFFKDTVFPAYLRVNAGATGVILNLLRENASVNGQSISSQRFSIDLRHGCDAVLPSFVFVAATMASPVALWTKIPGVLVGTAILLLMNLARIVTLFYTGIYFPSLFESMHLEIWPAIFILLAIFLWVIWALWAKGERGSPRHASG